VQKKTGEDGEEQEKATEKDEDKMKDDYQEKPLAKVEEELEKIVAKKAGNEKEADVAEKLEEILSEGRRRMRRMRRMRRRM